jgi:hypothetical protein
MKIRTISACKTVKLTNISYFGGLEVDGDKIYFCRNKA